MPVTGRQTRHDYARLGTGAGVRSVPRTALAVDEQRVAARTVRETPGSPCRCGRTRTSPPVLLAPYLPQGRRRVPVSADSRAHGSPRAPRCTESRFITPAITPLILQVPANEQPDVGVSLYCGDSPGSRALRSNHAPTGYSRRVIKVGRLARRATKRGIQCPCGLPAMELGGLEPPTSWVRSRRSPN